MKKIVKWISIAVGVSIAISIVAIVIMLAICRNPSIEPIPKAYLQANQIWSSELHNEEIQILMNHIVLKIEVTSVPTCGTTIQYPDEKTPRDIFPEELYFGATDIKFNEKSGIIYVKVAGRNAVCGPTGERIFEFDARRRESVRNYWVRSSG